MKSDGTKKKEQPPLVSVVVNNLPITWNEGNHGFNVLNTDSVLFWVKPSLLSMLQPLMDEMGEDLYSRVIAYEASKGTYEDYHAMVTTMGKTFEEGFLNWGEAVSACGWGRFKILEIDTRIKEATIRIENPWELRLFHFKNLQNNIPFLNGKVSGVFSHAFETNCRSEVIEISDPDSVEKYVILHLKPSLKTLEQALLEIHHEKDINQTNLRAQNSVLRRDQRRLLDIIETVGEVIWESDRNLQITYATDKAPEVLHLQGQNVVGKTLVDILGEHQYKKLKALTDSLVDSRNFVESEFEYSVKSKTYWILLRIKRLLDYNGNHLGFVGSARDITAQKELAAQLLDQQKNTQFASKMATLGEMAGGIAHEINTPLAVIKMNSEEILESLEEKAVSPEAIEKNVSTILKTVTRIAKIVQGLRAFARDANQDSLETTQIKSIVDDALSLCASRFASQGIEIRVKLESNPEVQCRSTQIAQVLLNLLNNAYDIAADLEEKWVEITSSMVKDKIEIRITDSGKGISSHIQDKMMSPFFTTKPIGKGTGLGLSISKGIIESHGGTLRYDANAKNTTFVIQLPVV